jgi:tetratricopeptide (TPR) repeat protein
MQAAKNYFEQQEYTQAEISFKNILVQEPNNLEAIESLGDIAAIKKDWDLSVFYYRKLVQLQNNHAEFHYKYGGVLGMKALENKMNALGLVGRIRNAFKTAVALDPDYVDPKWALIDYYLELPGILGGSVKHAKLYANELERVSKIEGLMAHAYIATYDDELKKARNFQKEALQYIDEVSSSYKRNNLHYQIGKACAINNMLLDEGLQHLEYFLLKHKDSDRIAKEWVYYYQAQLYRLKNKKAQATIAIKKANSNSEVNKLGQEELKRINAL